MSFVECLHFVIPYIHPSTEFDPHMSLVSALTFGLCENIPKTPLNPVLSPLLEAFSRTGRTT